MVNDLMISEIARARIRDLYHDAEVRRLDRLARKARRRRSAWRRFTMRRSHSRRLTTGQRSVPLPRQRATPESRPTVGHYP